ncbi:acyl-ACP thioesterase domain-containing protein [Lagierella sp.]|uniref:acyl-ACP thioesterase domain-containing protein n=1 Tax=Lagierella sp. TaxID=2849657 RepID=UPI002638DD18|nr:acyl-ACP thioesterase domain-containing protein [Lagierella sp.]
MNKTFEQEFNLYGFDKKSGKIDLTKIFDIICETAVSHSHRDDTDFFDDIFWVVYRWDMSILKELKIRTKVRVRTEIVGVRKFFALRDFTVYDEEGQECIKVKSEWILLSKSRRSPVRIPKSYIEGYDIKEVKNLLVDLKIPEDLKFTYNFKRPMGQLDIDVNNHVNNVVYTELMLNTLDPDIKVKEISIIYKKESFSKQVLNAKRTDIVEVDKGKYIYICIYDEKENLKTVGRVIVGE